jgi:hypothetical protein
VKSRALEWLKRHWFHGLIILVLVIPHLWQFGVTIPDLGWRMLWGDPAKVLWVFPLGYLAALLSYDALRVTWQDPQLSRKQRGLGIAIVVGLPAILFVIAVHLSQQVATLALDEDVPASENIPYPTDFHGPGYGALCRTYLDLRDKPITELPPEKKHRLYLAEVRARITATDPAARIYPGRLAGVVANAAGFALAGFVFSVALWRFLVNGPFLFQAVGEQFGGEESPHAPPGASASNHMALSVVLFICWVTVLYPISSYFTQFRDWWKTVQHQTFLVPALAACTVAAIEIFIRSTATRKASTKVLGLLFGAATAPLGSLLIRSADETLAFFIALCMSILFILSVAIGLDLMKDVLAALAPKPRPPDG